MSQASTQHDAAAEPESQDLVVKCVGLTKVFRDFWMRNRVTAVDSIDLDIHQGEVFGLLGPNGSGKSTTIKLMLGLLHPSAGRIAVFGRHPRDVKNKQRIGEEAENLGIHYKLTPYGSPREPSQRKRQPPSALK